MPYLHCLSGEEGVGVTYSVVSPKASRELLSQGKKTNASLDVWSIIDTPVEGSGTRGPDLDLNRFKLQ